MVKMRTSTAIAKFLEKAGTEYFFGYVGHGNWALLDAQIGRASCRERV